MAVSADTVASTSANPLLLLWRTSIGKKVVMAVTGVILVGFVFGHMAGNLKIYTGEEHFNAYAAWLREMGAPLLPHEGGLWIARIVLLIATALHITAAVQLTLTSQAARPVAYGTKDVIQAGYASRTMRWGGAIITLFVIYHLLHFTFGVVGYGAGQFRPLSVYRNVILGFSVWYVSAFYIAAMVALGLHMYHGVWSMFQTLGVSGASRGSFIRGLAAVLSFVVVLGNISVPLMVLAGVLR